MKKRLKFGFIFASCCASFLFSSCNKEPTPKPKSTSPSSSILSSAISQSSVISSSLITTSTVPPIDHKFSFQLKNRHEENVVASCILVDGEVVEFNLTDGIYIVTTVTSKIGKLMMICADNYQNKQVIISSEKNLGIISIEEEFSYIAGMDYSSYPEFGDWRLYSVRGYDSIRFMFESDNESLSIDKTYLNFYINTFSTGESLTFNDYLFKLKNNAFFVYDFGALHQQINLTQFNYSIQKNNLKTQLYFDIPYSFLGIDNDAVVGINFNEYLIELDFANYMIYNGITVNENITKNYLRINFDSYVFTSEYNEETV